MLHVNKIQVLHVMAHIFCLFFFPFLESYVSVKKFYTYTCIVST
jgi:hypothetical protein